MHVSVRNKTTNKFDAVTFVSMENKCSLFVPERCWYGNNLVKTTTFVGHLLGVRYTRLMN